MRLIHFVEASKKVSHYFLLVFQHGFHQAMGLKSIKNY